MGFDVRGAAYGAEARECLARAVQEARSGDPLAPVTLMVPTNYAGVAARRQLARRGGLAAATFLTVRRLAEMLAAARLAEVGRRPVSTPVLHAGVRRVLEEEPGIFAAVAGHRATEEALAGAHLELAELDDEALDRLAGASAKASEVVRVHRRLDQLLVSAWFDEADLMEEAAAALGTDPLTRARLDRLGALILHLPQDLSPRAADLLRAVAEDRAVRVVVGLTGSPDADDGVFRSLARLGAELPTVAPPRRVADLIVSASDPDEEVRRAVRLLTEAASQGVPFGRMSLLYTVTDPYARLVADHLAAAGLPHNGAPVRTLGEASYGAAIRQLLRLGERHLARSDVMALVNTAPVRWMNGPVPAASWERISRQAGVVKGEHWQERLAAWAATARSRADELEAEGRDVAASLHRLEGERAEALAGFVDGLRTRLQEINVAPCWAAKAGRLVELAHALLGGHATRRSWPPEETEAAEGVEAAIERVGRLDALGGPPPSSQLFLRTLDAELDSGLPRTGRLGEGVLTGHVSVGLGVDCDLLVVLGMAEGSFPAACLEDPLLGDADRQAAGDGLASSSLRRGQDHRHLLAAMAAASRSVLCFPRGDLRCTGGRAASRWLLDDAAVLSGRSPIFTGDLPPAGTEWFDHVSSFAAGVASGPPSTAAEFRLKALMGHAGHLTSHPLVRSDPAWNSAVELLTARAGDRFTRFDGDLSNLSITRPTWGDMTTSATRLEAWATCPFGYLMEHLLSVEVPEDPEDLVEMTALDKGSLMHRVLERFITEALDTRSADGHWSKAQRARLLKLASVVCDEYEAAGRVGRDPFWHRDRTRLLADLDRFVDEDNARMADLGCRPRAAELGFGLRSSSRPALEMVLPDGRALRLRGSVDRVDECSDGRLVVTDYKTGSASSYQGLSVGDSHQAGTRLQLQTYGLFARAAYGSPETPVHADYWFVTRKGEFKRIGFDLTEEVMSDYLSVLSAICDGIEAGVFPAVPPEGTWTKWSRCPYCDPDGLGVADRRREWQRKSADPALAVYRRLAGEGHA